MTDHITVIGNIATDPEQRRTTAGIAVTSFRVASSQRHFDARSGEWVDGLTNWYRVSAFRALGENAFTSLSKGQRIIVTGKLKLKEWEAGGKKGIEVEIDADGLGHDLQWGTSSFTRVVRSDARPPATAVATSGDTRAAVAPTDADDGARSEDAASEAAADWAPVGAGTPF